METPDKRQTNPQEKMIQNEAKYLLENAIRHLGAKYKVIYMMKEVEVMSIKQIDMVLDLTTTNVKVRLHQSIEMLRDKIFEISSHQHNFEFGFSRCDRITERVM